MLQIAGHRCTGCTGRRLLICQPCGRRFRRYEGRGTGRGMRSGRHICQGLIAGPVGAINQFPIDVICVLERRRERGQQAEERDGCQNNTKGPQCLSRVNNGLRGATRGVGAHWDDGALSPPGCSLTCYYLLGQRLCAECLSFQWIAYRYKSLDGEAHGYVN